MPLQRPSDGIPVRFLDTPLSKEVLFTIYAQHFLHIIGTGKTNLEEIGPH